MTNIIAENSIKNGSLSIRQRNTIGSRLAASKCIFWVSASLPLDRSANPDKTLRQFLKLGGTIESDYAHSRHGLLLQINHKQMDAFGGLYVICSSSNIQDRLVESKILSGTATYCFDMVQINHYWRKATNLPVASPDRTFTQQFAANLLKYDSTLDSVDMCVACDDITKLSLNEIAGNSLGLVKIPKKRLEALVRMPRADWADFLKKRSFRSLELSASDLGPVPSSAVKPSPVLISSIGDISKIPWVSNRLNPSNFMMSPTPDRDAVNIVLWSAQGIQGLSISYYGGKSSALTVLLASILAAWKELVQ